MAPFYQLARGLLTGAIQLKNKPAEIDDSLTTEFKRLRLEADRIVDLIAAARLSHENPSVLGMAVFYLVMREEQWNLEPDDTLDIGMMQRLAEDEQATVRDLLARLETLTDSANHSLAGQSALILGVLWWALSVPEQALASLYRA